MRVGIIQSNYIPWRGFFDFIDDVNLFIFHDDLQYTKGDWRNRNLIKTHHGRQWLTVPVKQGHTQRLIMETEIDYSQHWPKVHFNKLQANYYSAPFMENYINDFMGIINQKFSKLSDLNVALCLWLMEMLEIRTPVRFAPEFSPVGKRTAKLLDILTKVGAQSYLSGPSGANYLDVELFRRHGIQLEFKSYDYPPYPQLWGEFVGEVSVLDLLFNTGPEARRYLKSQTPNRRVV
jgi:hypothetical protein